MITEICCIGPNLGDLVAPVSKWLDLGGVVSRVDCKSFEATNLLGRDVLFGPGGWGHFGDLTLEIAARNKRSIAWGWGTNSTNVKGPENPPKWLSSFSLASSRDWGTEFTWVPCTSCLSPAFDTPRGATHDVVLFMHYERPILVNLDVPTRTNESSPERAPVDFAATLDFLASGKTVLTNSYHGAYWATLLGRPVVVVEPWSSKFYRMRHTPAMAPEVLWRKAAEVAPIHRDALAECREACLAFGKRVRALFSEPRGK